MNEDTHMTPLQIWLHPRRAASQIAALRQVSDTQGEELHSLKEAYEALSAEVNGMRGERSALQAENTELSLKLIRAREEFEAQQKDISDIEHLVNRMGEMKEFYEKRILRLKDKIADLNGALRREIDTAPGGLAPLSTSFRPSVSPVKSSPESSADDSADDWYSPIEL